MEGGGEGYKMFSLFFSSPLDCVLQVQKNVLSFLLLFPDTLVDVAKITDAFPFI